MTRPGEPDQGTRKRVLFVDDEPNMLDMLGRMLTQCGDNWEGEFCLGVDEALNALSRASFDTIVSDIRMPKRDGLALIEAVRADERLCKIPIIILTGEADRTLKRRVLDMGATDLLNKPVSREDLAARLRSALRLKQYQDQLENQVDILDGLVRERTKQLERSHREVVWRLAKAGEFRDDQTGNHVARVAWCSRIVAQGLGLDAAFVETLFQTSPLHDIGKIGIPDSILLAPRKLTEQERAAMQKHTLIGEQILRREPKAVSLVQGMEAALLDISDDGDSVPLLKMASSIARCHHEKWDGTGYPDGMKGEDIPIEARIVAVVDVYDALRSTRPYKEAMSEIEAGALVRHEAGTHFDPRIVAAFTAKEAEIQAMLGSFDRSVLSRKPQAKR